MLRVLDLFSGIGGFSLGLERTGGFKTVAFCEIDPFCRHVLAKHWPGVPIHEDVRKLRGEEVGAIDVICGGFPCQDISLAGAGAGLTGERSGLWSEYRRLIGEIRPAYVLVENVSALRARGLGTVLGDLASLRYDAEWDSLFASDVGAPHRRDRVWIVAYPNGGRWAPRHGHIQAAGYRHSSSPGGDDGDAYSPRLALWQSQRGDARAQQQATVGANWWATEPDVGRVAHGVPSKLDGVVNAEEHHPAPSADSRSDADGMRGVRRGKAPSAASPRLLTPESFRDSLSAMSRPGGPEGRSSAHEAAEELQGLRQGVHAHAQQEPHDMQPGVPFSHWPHERGEAVGIWSQEPDVPRVAHGVKNRVQRLRGLGNAVIPQITEEIGRAILRAEEAISNAA